MLELIPIDESTLLEVADYKEEFVLNHEIIHGGAGLDLYDDLTQWLAALNDNAHPETLRPNRVTASTYLARRKKDGKIVGIIDIRHYLNNYLLLYGGHIGYSIRKSERRKGYAKEMLGLALKKCESLGIDKVLITCDKENPASARTILANGGVLENEIMHEDKLMQRYWIQLKKENI